MAAVYKLYQWTGATPTKTNLGSGATPPTVDMGFKGNDDPGVPAIGDEFAREDLCSWAMWVVPNFASTFTTMTGIKGWVSDVVYTHLGTGAIITGVDYATASYSQVVSGANTGDPDMPTSMATALNLSTAGLAAGTPGDARAVRMQVEVGADADQGEWEIGIFNVYWVET